jgi:glycosyltransferase involved in cell wall biosynthesis
VKKVWFVSSTVGAGGGAERSLFYLIEAAVLAGYEATLVAPEDGVVAGLVREAGLSCEMHPGHGMPSQLRTRAGSMPFRFATMAGNAARAVRAGVALGREASRRRIDLIHCNNLMPNLLGGLAAVAGASAVVWHVRDIHTRAPRLAVQRKLAKNDHVKRIVCVSEAAARQYKSVAGEKIRVVYNGIDCDAWDRDAVPRRLRSEHSELAERFIVGCHGRLADWKGYDIVMRAVARLKDAIPEIALVILGDANPAVPSELAYKAELQELVSELDLERQVFMLGYRPDVRPSLGDVDVYVLASTAPDPFPRAVLEAMCLGLPIVASDTGGIPEALQVGSEAAGVLVTPGDANALASRLRTLHDDKDARDRLGRSAARTVKEHFTLSRYRHDMLTVFEEATA